MSIERFYIERLLIFRVPGIKKINSVHDNPFTITVYIGDKDGKISELLLEMAKKVIEEYRPLGFCVFVKPYSEGPGDAVSVCQLSEELKKAGIYNSPTKTDLELLMKNFIPGCFYAEAITVAGGVIDIYIGDETGNAPSEMVQRAQQLLKEIYGPDIKYTLYDYNKLKLSRNKTDKKNIFFQTSRFDPVTYKDNELRKIARKDEEIFRDILGKLIEGKADYRKDLDCRLPKGEGVYAGLFISEEDLEVLLTLYPRVYLCITQDDNGFIGSEKNKKFIQNDMILRLAQIGRVTPVFHAPLYQYKPKTVLSFLEESKDQVLLPRQLDGLTILTMAKQFPFWRLFRQDPQIAAEIYYYLYSSINELKKSKEVNSLFYNVLKDAVDTHLTVAERGEQWFLDRGHIAAGNLTAGGIIDSFLKCNEIAQKLDKAKKDTIIIEAYSYSMEMIIARALGSVYFPSMVLNEPVLNIIANLQAGPKGRIISPSENHLETILKGLHIARPEHVPLDEYLEIITSSEADRLRHIITDIIFNSKGNIEQINEEVEKFNIEVKKWRRSKISWITENIDIIGLGLDMSLVPTGISIPGITSFFGMIIKAIYGNVLENTLFKDIEDKIFGAIGGVSPSAIRISKIRRKIGTRY